MMGGDKAGSGSMFLRLLDARDWQMADVIKWISNAIDEAFRDDPSSGRRKRAREGIRNACIEFEQSRSMSNLQDLRGRIATLDDEELVDALRVIDLILAEYGYRENAGHMAAHLVRIAQEEITDPADRAYRIQQSLGWISHAAGRPGFDDDLSRVGSVRGNDLLSYKLAQMAGVSSIDPRLIGLSTFVGDEIVRPGSERYRERDLTAGLPTHIFGDPYLYRYEGASCENPQSATGISANVIAQRFPMLSAECDAIVRRPDDASAIRNLMERLQEFPADVREEVEELNRLLALLGDRQALLEAACYLMVRGYHAETDYDRSHSLRMILGLIAIASGARPLSSEDLHSDDGALNIAHGCGTFLIEQIEEHAVEVAKKRDIKSGATLSESQVAEVSDFVTDPSESVDESEVLITTSSAGFLARRGYVQICKQIMEAGGKEHNGISSRYGSLTKAMHLKQPALPAHHLRDRLLEEFPHATDAIGAIVSDLEQRELAGDGTFQIRPTLLLGAPGCGKSRLAGRIGDLVKMPWRMIPAAGVSDAHIAGVSRGWHSGMPSAPIELMRSGQCPNPILVIDEIEKAALSRHNGNLIDSILPWLEPGTAKSWLDPYLQAECDLSHVSWLFTANSLENLPHPFRDRVRVIEVPAPGLQHIKQLAKTIVRELRPDHVLTEMMPDLDPTELQILIENWQPGLSIRSLQRMVRALLAARDETAARH